EAIPVYLLLSNRVNSLRLIPLVSSLIDTYWLLVCDRPVIDYLEVLVWRSLGNKRYGQHGKAKIRTITTTAI
ncbi:hypothetical protein LC609_37790, partial [Nostoc sp. XA013]|nr:hypothetical protein [Nostoc sp. XA013]